MAEDRTSDSMGEVSTGRTVGTKTFLVLMTVMIIVFLAGLLIMNNNYTSMQSELTATRAQVSSLESTLYNLNQNYTLLQEVRNYLLAQVDELTEQANLTQVVSRTFSYSIAMDYDNKTLFFDDGMGGESAIRSPTVSFVTVDLTPQTGESIVAQPWVAPLSAPQWLKEPETETPVEILLHTNAIRAYFTPATFSWEYDHSWDYVEDVYREHHDYFDITLTGTVQLLYFSQNKTFTLALFDNINNVIDQITLQLP
jgi:cell division protein FtsL